jgi:hypothetical protein
MKITLTKLEVNALMSWRSESESVLPNEKVLLDILKNHVDGEIELTENQLVILSSWAEGSVDKNFGSGAITNIVEKQILDKIKSAYASIPSSRNIPDKKDKAEKNQTVDSGSSKMNNILKLAIITLISIGIALFLFLPPSNTCECIGTKECSTTTSTDFSIQYLVGDVSIKNGDCWRPLKLGTIVNVGDSIKTGIASKVQLINGDRRIDFEEERTAIIAP